MSIFSGRWSLFWLVLGVLACVALFSGLNARFFFFSKSPKWPATVNGYVIQPVPDSHVLAPLPPLPDLSGYTAQAILDKIPPVKPGKVKVSPMTDGAGFGKFTENARLPKFAKMQGRKEPVGIHILSGTYDLESLRLALNNPDMLSREGNVWTFNYPIDIAPGAGLILSGTPDQRAIVRMTREPGAFIVNSGLLIIADAEIWGWSKKNAAPLIFDGDSSHFRPFVAVWNGSETYFLRSDFFHMGYHESKAYGITFSSDKGMLKLDPFAPSPKGWILECRFEGMYYGFYSYEADGIAIIRNLYVDNIIYGIDPHDRSRHLIIAENEVYGTQKKHGIIVSREVDDSWIFDNYSHNNHGSGFMLDRTSVRNVVARNRSYNNQADGMTLFESQDNVVYGNKLIGNGKNGLRVRNSWNIDARDNVIAFNGGNGVQVYDQDLRDREKHRDFNQDPFTQRASLDLSGGVVAFNSAGGVKSGGVDYLRLTDVEFFLFTPRFIRGDLDDFGTEIVQGMLAHPKGIEARKGEGETRQILFMADPDDLDLDDSDSDSEP
ncbi:MAG: right-handed parallel beta-helix repeat-containing protein [Rhodospirillales bacterium]|nr:right-handed parallel beta-helix repeat-containing protein [Rhodospirillales bacterium]